MKLTSYKKTGYYYIDDEAEDDYGNEFEEKVYEYFFYFDDGTAFPGYLAESLIAGYDFSENNERLKRKYEEAKATNQTEKNIQQEADALRRRLCREFGIENNNFPINKSPN